MFKEEELIEFLETGSGMKLGKDFGFIIGTVTPYIPIGLVACENKSQGFELWKIDSEGNKHELRTVSPDPGLMLSFLSMNKEEFRKYLEMRAMVIEAE